MLIIVFAAFTVSARTFVDCYKAFSLLKQNYSSGVYFLKEESATDMVRRAFCDEDGWTVFQSRGPYGNPASFFYRDWEDYVKGFGDPGDIRLHLGRLQIHGLSFWLMKYFGSLLD